MRYRSLICAVTVSLAIASSAFAIEDFEVGREAAHRGDFATAYAIWKKASDAGDAKSTLALGKMYFYGHGVTKDLAHSKQLVGEAVQQGVPGAEEFMGRVNEELAAGGSGNTRAAAASQPSGDKGGQLAGKSAGDGTADRQMVDGVVRKLRASYEAVSSQYPASGIEGDPVWSVDGKVDPMSDVRVLEAVTRIEMDDKQSSFELKFVCSPDGSGTSLTVTSAPDSFERRPAPSGKPFIYYLIRFGNQPAKEKKLTDRLTKFSNVMSIDFPVKAYMPIMLKYARKANPQFDLLVRQGLVKFEDGFPGNTDDIVSADVVRFKFEMSRTGEQVIAFHPGAPSLRPFFNECFKVMDAAGFLKEEVNS